MRDLLSSRDTVIAVVGATDSPGKYGGVIYRNLKRKGFQVRAVNPNRTTVDGDPSYPDLASVPDEIDIVNMVIPPRNGMPVVEEAIDLDLDMIWFQEGSESPDLSDRASDAGLRVIDNACIMVVTTTLV